MKLTVNKKQRYAKMRAHTATHLLHFALEKLLGNTKQAWSLVDDDYLRFDFACKDPLSYQDLLMMESSINAWIAGSIDVSTQELTMDEAKKTWAKAFFEDKYGDTVRVVQMKGEVADDLDLHSIELCGGTHVPNTSHIGVFKITNHSSVSSGIRRIEAVTWTQVAQYATTLDTTLLDLSKKLDCQPSQLQEKLDKILKEKEHLESDHASLQGKIICTHLDEFQLECELPSAWSKWWKGCILNVTWTDLEHHSFKEVILAAKWKRSDRNWILYNEEGNYAIYTGTGDLSAKEFAKEQWLKGGGSDQFVQGKDEKILEIT